MFNNPRYITKGINDTVPFALQLLMWNLIDTMNISHKDYLQVFELSEDDGKQKIVHNSTAKMCGRCLQRLLPKAKVLNVEQPAYEKTYSLNSANTSFLYAKIFVIDDHTHSTMLLASEY